MEKENKNKFAKPSFANVSDGRAMRIVQQQQLTQQTFEGVLNSTAKSHADFLMNEADLSTISCSVYEFKAGPLASQASSGAAKSDLNFMVNSNDLNSKQIELNCWYSKYLTIQTINETAKASFRNDEEPIMRDLMELHKAEETLKKNQADLELEERLYENLINLTMLVNMISKFFRESKEDLRDFLANYKRLNEMCSEAKNYIDIINIHTDQDCHLEESLSVELNRTLLILNQIMSLFDENKLTKPPRSKEMLDMQLFGELKDQYSRLKQCVLKYNALQAMDSL